MRLSDRIRKAIAVSRDEAAGQQRQAYIPDWFVRGLDAPWESENRLTKPYAQDPTIHRAVRVLADVVMSIPFELFVAGSEDVPLPASDAAAVLMRRPNPRMSGPGLMARTVMDLMLFGNSIWRCDGLARQSVERAGVFPTTLIPLPMSRTTPEIVAGRHIGWRVGQLVIPVEEVIHHRMEDPESEVLGLAEVAPTLLDARTSYIASMANMRIIKRGGPGIVLERSDPIFASAATPENDAALEKSFDENYGGEDDGAAAVLPVGVKIARSGATQREMDFERLLRYAQEAKAGALGVPPSVVGVLQYANYANMGSQLEYLFHFSVFPMTARIEAVVQTQLLDRYGRSDVACFFRKESVRALFQNLGALTDTAKKLFEMGVPLAEINNRLDLGLDLDGIETAEVSFLPMNMVAADIAAEPPEPSAPAAPAGPSAPAADDDEERDPAAAGAESIRGLYRERSAVQTIPVWPTDQRGRDLLWQRYERRFDSLERVYLGSYRTFLTWLRDRTTSQIRAGIEASAMTPSEAEYHREAIARTRKATEQAARSGAESVATELGVDLPFSLFDPRTKKLLLARTIAIKGASDEAVRRVRETLAKGIEKGETLPQLTERVSRKIAEERVGQARTVARTETAAAFSGQRAATMLEAGVERHEWLSARDDKVRDSHLIDGEQRALGEEFSNGLQFPLDPDGPASEVVNCRCVTIPIVKPEDK